MQNKKSRLQILFFSLGVIALVLRVILGYYPAFAEQVYARGIFPLIRWGFDHSLGLLPFPSVFLLIIILGVILFWSIINWRKMFRSSQSRAQKLGHFLMDWAAFMGFSLFLFMGLWGFNYARIPLEKHLELSVQNPDFPELANLGQRELDAAIEARAQIRKADTTALSSSFFQPEAEKVVREALSKSLLTLGYPTPGNSRVKLLHPGGLLFRLGITGIYLPFTGEGYIESNLTAPDLPFTMAHEMAHAQGFSDEGEANFLAFLALYKAEDPLLRYSAHLTLWRYVMHDLKPRNQIAFDQLFSNLSPGIKADIKHRNEVFDSQKLLFPKLSDWINDTYLKSQGVNEGVQSYSHLVRLVLAYER